MRGALSARKGVAIGGGTGLPRVLRCLLDLGFDTSAVVTMADDGGSTGMLREQMGILPPGDIRNCLVAMADTGSLPAQLFQYRFPQGEGLAGHALGNLVIAALTDLTQSFPDAIDAAGGLLDSQGRVLPSTLADVRLSAKDAAGRPISGQARLAHSNGPLADIELEPGFPKAYGPALEAIASAEVIVIGPGSLFTSILPNLLVEGVSDAIRRSEALRVYVCNVANQRGETSGMDAFDHLRTLIDHGLSGAIDVALVHDSPTPSAVAADASVRERMASLGPKVVSADLSDPGDPNRHSQDKLLAALREVIG